MKTGVIQSVGAAGLFALAGAAYGQCVNPTVTNTTGSIVNPNGVDIGNHGDDVSTNVALPFPVTYYGTVYNNIVACSNGWASFTNPTTATGYVNSCLPQSGTPAFNIVPGATIYAYWDDLTTGTTTNGRGIFTGVSGAAGSRTFTIEWRAYPLATTNPLNFAIQFHEGSSTIDLVYAVVVNGGLTATTGVQDGTGNFTQIQCNTGGLTAGQQITLSCGPRTALGASGSATPNSVQQTASTLLTVNVLPVQSPTPSTGITVRGNLSSIGGGTNQQFYDDGTHGDVTAGDNTFSFAYTIPGGAAVGAASVPFTASDAQSHTATGTIGFTITSAPTGSCCIAGACTPNLTAFACGAQGGSYNGNSSTCNGAAGTTYPSQTSFPVAIPDFANNTPGMGTATVTIPSGAGTIHNLGVRLGLTHTWVGDIIATLSNGSTTATLFYRVGSATGATVGNSDNLVGENIYLETADQSLWDVSTNVTTHDIPTGTYHPSGLGSGARPADSLAAFNGQPLTGTWTLTVTDNAGIDTGSITNLALFDVTPLQCGPVCGTADFNGDGDVGTDSDIEAFFRCLAGTCCATCFPGGADFNQDGDVGTDSDIEAFFRVLAGNPC